MFYCCRVFIRLATVFIHGVKDSLVGHLPFVYVSVLKLTTSSQQEYNKKDSRLRIVHNCADSTYAFRQIVGEYFLSFFDI